MSAVDEPVSNTREVEMKHSARRFAALVLCSGAFVACTPARPVVAVSPRLVPEPVSLAYAAGDAFMLTDSARIVIESGNAEVARTAQQLAAILRPSTGYAIPIATTGASARGAIVLRLTSGTESGAEGYELTVSRDSVRVTASTPAGIFHGVQTLRQLLPPQIESQMVLRRTRWAIPSVTIADRPRFSWRGAMLDVARHFFSVREVKQYLDVLALYKMNVLHLHLSDDQGWRIEIKSRPRLATAGGVTQGGGGPGGYYTQSDYSEIVRYAQERYITIVPEIDMPGHTNAALVGYPELSCSVRPPAPYTGSDVGWSTFCANKEETYALVDDVVREITALTPGRYFHMGGDENPILSKEEYATFVERTQEIVARHGKEMVGWEEIARAPLRPTTLSQAWKTDSVAAVALKYGAKVILSPGPRTYLDMKYDKSTELGQSWAGFIEIRDAYDWDPATYMKGVGEASIVGIEAPIWTESLRNISAVEYLAMPRLPALAEVGWTPQSTRDWNAFRTRIATHEPRWIFLGVNFYRSPQIPW
jgi:hexosaminidase